MSPCGSKAVGSVVVTSVDYVAVGPVAVTMGSVGADSVAVAVDSVAEASVSAAAGSRSSCGSQAGCGCDSHPLRVCPAMVGGRARLRLRLRPHRIHGWQFTKQRTSRPDFGLREDILMPWYTELMHQYTATPYGEWSGNKTLLDLYEHYAWLGGEIRHGRSPSWRKGVLPRVIGEEVPKP